MQLPIRSELFARLTGGLSRRRDAITAEMVPVAPPAVAATEIGTPAAPVPVAPSATRAPERAESTLGAAVGVPGAARRTRLALDPRVRGKLERLESSAAAARGEVFRLQDLIEAERQRQVELDRRYATLEQNYLSRADKGEVDGLHADRAACDAEIAQLTSLRDVAQLRWQRLNRLAERCRQYLGLPADERRG